MNDFDKYLKNKARNERSDVPDSVKNKIEETLAALPEQNNGKTKTKIKVLPRIISTAACFILVAFFVLPNISIAYASMVENVPVIGKIVKVITIRNYFYSDDSHEIDVNVPEVILDNNESDDLINQDINALTERIINQFYSDLEIYDGENHSAVSVDYETVTDTDKWFTLKIKVHETAASSNTYYKYYHINKITGKTVTLNDIALNESFYTAIENEIKRQMQEEMKLDNNKIYWLNDSVIGEDFVSISPNHNFYLSESGDIFIIFDKYEVAPGYMGTPEFKISRNIISDFIKPEFKDIFF